MKTLSEFHARTRATRRKTDYLKALRKRRIDHDRNPELFAAWPYYNNLHQYSKNKIHCSCPMCASKSRPKKYYYGTSKDCWGFRDQRQFNDMDLQMEELFSIENFQEDAWQEYI